MAKYEWQEDEEGAGRREVTVYSDSDFAGCRRTARSTSGGVALVGKHFIKGWSSTQKTVALSSGEAELTALVKASCEALGLVQLLESWGKHERS